MASWYQEPSRPQPDPGFYRGLGYALLLTLVAALLVYAAVKFSVWNGAR